MGIASDQLVVDYLSRVGDLAHGTSMTAAERARLVNGLRGEIDRMRAADGGAESKAAVRRILGRLGKPEEVVSARGGQSVSPGGLSDVVLPQPREGAAPGGREGSRQDGTLGARARARAREAREQARVRLTKQPGSAPEDDDDRKPEQRGPTLKDLERNAPHLAGLDELAPDADPDWWRVESGPAGRGGGTGRVSGGDLPPGFTGGIEIPEVLLPPPEDDDEEEGAAPPPAPDGAAPAPQAPHAPPTAPGTGEGDGETVAKGGRPSVGALLLAARRRRAGGGGGPRAGGFIELAAAALLLAGAVFGSLIPLGIGWLAAWCSPRLSRTEAKWAAAGMPGLVLVGTAVWLWGRTEGKWGEPMAQGGEAMRAALTETGPVLLRVAAVASAVYLVWRARRTVGG